jgi:hypothetical protein
MNFSFEIQTELTIAMHSDFGKVHDVDKIESNLCLAYIYKNP